MISQYYLAIQWVVFILSLGYFLNFFIAGRFLSRKNIFIRLPFFYIAGSFLITTILHIDYFFSLGLSNFIASNFSLLFWGAVILVVYLFFKSFRVENLNLKHVFFLVLSLVVFIPFFKEALFSFMIFWDTAGIWFLKAVAFFYSDSFWDTKLFTDELSYIYSHKSYPVGIPLLVAQYFKIIGFVNDQAAKILPSFYFYLIFLFFFGFLLEKKFSAGKFFFVLATLLSPIFLIYSLNAYADLPLSLSFLLNFYLLYQLILLKEKRFFSDILALGFINTGWSILVKYEALPFAILSLLILAIVSFSKKYRIRLKDILIFLFSILSFILWRIFLYKMQINLYLQESILDSGLILSRLRLLVNLTLTELSDTSRFGLLITLILGLFFSQVIFWIKKRSWIWMCFSLLWLGQLSFYFLIYLITPFDMRDQFLFSFERLFLQLMPSLLFIVLISVDRLVLSWKSKNRALQKA